MTTMSNLAELKKKYKSLVQLMDEKTRRIWAATEASSIGWGGVSLVAKATGLSRTTITLGMSEIEGRVISPERIRKSGGGRKTLAEGDPNLVKELERLVESTTRGDPESPLRWTCKSTRNLAAELSAAGHNVSYRTVAAILNQNDYSLQANQKTREGSSDPDRNAQFEYINEMTKKFQSKNQPIISVDTKKKELIGDFKNGGREWKKKGDPEKVQVHDFGYADLGKGIPYGVFDITKNQGWVSVGTDHDTAEFAVETIRRWWKKMGFRVYPKAKELLITADGGGSNASRSTLWKAELQRLADELGLAISVCHLPPGTSKWNKIEHRMFSFISQNWRGKPLYSHQVMVNLIGGTTTKTGLKIKAKIDNGLYETGKKVSRDEIKALKITLAEFRGDWNYKLEPR